MNCHVTHMRVLIGPESSRAIKCNIRHNLRHKDKQNGTDTLIAVHTITWSVDTAIIS